MTKVKDRTYVASLLNNEEFCQEIAVRGGENNNEACNVLTLVNASANTRYYITIKFAKKGENHESKKNNSD